MNDSPGYYQPIDCNVYDQLEIAALRERPIVITYIDKKELKTISTTIKTLITENKVEYLVTIDDERIRLDLISSLRKEDGQVIVELSENMQKCNMEK